MGSVKLLCILALFLCLGVSLNSAIPLEAQQRILDELNDLGLGDVIGEPIPVYRLDKAEDFVAYYMVEANDQYLLISAAEETGDASLALQGTVPSPITALDNEATAAGSSCAKYYLMLPNSDSLICKNSDGEIAATTLSEQYKAIAQDSEGYTSLEAYIIGQLSELKKQWEEHAAYIKQQTVVEEPSDKAADDKDSLKLQNTNPNGKSGDGFAIYPISTGESKDIATGNGVSKVIITYIPRDGESSADAKAAQIQLCNAIENCKMKKGEGKISGKNVVTVANDAIHKVVIALKNDSQDILGGKEPVFSVDVFKKKNKVVHVVYQVVNPPEGKGYQYGSWSAYVHRYVPYYNLLPSYGQHRLYGCWPGSVAAGWAFIFGYYDRRTHYGNWAYGSHNLYKNGYDGFYGYYYQVAPSVNDYRLDRYMRRLGQTMYVKCNGVTYYSKIPYVENFFKARQYGNPSLQKCYTSSYSSTCANYVFDKVSVGWPVLTLYNNQGVVAIGRKESIRKRRYCWFGIGWFCGSWKIYQRRRYMLIDTLKVGYSRSWVPVKAFYAIIAQH